MRAPSSRKVFSFLSIFASAMHLWGVLLIWNCLKSNSSYWGSLNQAVTRILSDCSPLHSRCGPLGSWLIEKNINQSLSSSFDLHPPCPWSYQNKSLNLLGWANTLRANLQFLSLGFPCVPFNLALLFLSLALLLALAFFFLNKKIIINILFTSFTCFQW